MTQESERIYWGYSTILERQNTRLKKSPISEENKGLIRRFQNHLATTGTKNVRIAKLTWGLRHICELLNRPLDAATKADIERVVAAIQNNPRYKESTKADYKRCLKHFFNWWEDEDPRLESGDEESRKTAEKMYKYLRKRVKTTCPLPDVDPGSIITNEEINQVLTQGCRTFCEKAFVKFLHETGCRIGETLGIRIKDVLRKESLWLVRVSGKTGERRVPIRESIPYLIEWLNNHPDVNNPDAYLWVSLHNRWRGQGIRYWGARHLIKRCFKDAGITGKKINPHHWRHSRATYDAEEFTDSIRCELRGWRQGSQMVKRYTHMSGQQVEDAFKRVKGIEFTDVKPPVPKEQVCAVCREINTASALYCHKCGKALKIETAVKEQEYLTLAFKLLEEIMTDPEKKARYEAFKAGGGA